jgi:hypothetical protein
VPFWITWQSGEVFNIQNWGNNKEKHSGANHWHHACLTKLLGEVQEEERDRYETRHGGLFEGTRERVLP